MIMIIIIIIIIIIVIVIIIIIITLLLLFIYCNREVLANRESFSLIIIPILLFCFIGGRGKVANLYDNLHPGTVSGKLDGLWLVKLSSHTLRRSSLLTWSNFRYKHFWFGLNR